ncbi:tetraacyldisaccharide 4'-kinase [Hanstruepera neustonica]|uniref:Tetraacyldisaccharide 4'-kinase n=1 Tax=Hanstruepera neustonica TaxID=1445657 RepID=A0A2K1E4W5_9FLAO|nr:tetraacyldisaccharide 4'-kinase [Hanstruepera neustonica]PNQ75324.1 tetraacyldisaccharide 4'-kinase [Hanstruepera neustonica]
MKFLRIILFPVVPFYFVVTWLRNKFYDWGLKESKSYDFPVVCVGNLSTGGTGKTPMVEYLIRLLKDDYVLATLSRGYKRETKGFVLASEAETANTIGDEPFQFYYKYQDQVHVAVDENRQEGITILRQLENKPNLIILDDAFQHRKVKASVNILLTAYNNLYTDDIVLPSGDLREPRSGAKRAQMIVVTKCPDSITKAVRQQIISRINPKSHQTVYFSSIMYSDTVCSATESKPLSQVDNFTLVTGIANPKPLLEFLDNQGKTYEHIGFKDHYNFTEEDIKKLQEKEQILTTEKDYMRLMNHESLINKLYYLPIETKVHNSGSFNKRIKELIEMS